MDVKTSEHLQPEVIIGRHTGQEGAEKPRTKGFSR